MKTIKGNQVIAITIAILLMVIGYMNYNGETQNMETAKMMDYADATSTNENLGDVQLVSSVSTDEASDSQTETNKQNTSEETKEELIAQTSADSYFENSRIEREKMYSEYLETYRNMLESESVSSEQKAIATKEIEDLTNEKKAITITENLIKTKGFEDVIIFVNNGSVSVIVKSDDLDQAQIAQLQNIITRELGVEITNINMSHKK